MPRKPRLTQSQPTRSRQGQRASQEEAATRSLTQTAGDQQFPLSQTINIDEQINNCVRYIVYNCGHNPFVRRADLVKQCAPKAGHQFQQIIERVSDILKNIYGYNVMVCDQTATSAKGYIVSNSLPYCDYEIDYDANHTVEDDNQYTDNHKILLLLILSHILMSNTAVSEGSLYTFLGYFGIDPDRRHSLFGRVKDYITNVLSKQKYLLVETDTISKKSKYSWGVRAEKEISKHEVLDFVCKMYKKKSTKSWTQQYKEAEEQNFENQKIEDDRTGSDEE